jgi:hypothetical protein
MVNENKENDVYERRKAILGIGNSSILFRDSPLEEYGQVQEMNVNSDGRRVTAVYSGEERNYFVPADGAWMSGGKLGVTQAYRILESDKDIMQVIEVKNISELESVANGMKAEIRRILNKGK